MKFKYRPSWGFIAVLVVIGLLAKCNSDLFVPKTDLQIQRKVDSQLMEQSWKLEKQLDTIPSKDFWRLPEFDSREYALIKRNNIMLFIPRYYYGAGGVFTIAWPSDTNRLLNKHWETTTPKGFKFRVFMYSPQYFQYRRGLGSIESFSNTPCQNKESYQSFKWKGILIDIFDSSPIDNTQKNKLRFAELSSAQQKDLCLTTLKILNDEIKEVHYVR